MSTANQILNLFANSPVLCSVPRIQENVLAECDDLAQLALSHITAFSTATPTDLRISKFGLCDVAFDVRDPEVALIRHYTAKKDRAQCPAPLLWAPPPSVSESDWYSVDGYKGIVTPGGVVLSKAKCIHDSMFGQVYVEMWEIPESSTQKGFSVADNLLEVWWEECYNSVYARVLSCFATRSMISWCIDGPVPVIFASARFRSTPRVSLPSNPNK
ncbi:hypothetical protein C8F04DRAFT_1236730 [Mycena alexandri]|uniref:Uncharacterized protein n=1 Tax=Mycena alexandri TaxID=1745969 RepID=A0AAD6SL46_9AGAR|nr:hypothetical protein C8F04DRAFT_1236730 [Mycena alexandri]